VISLEYHRVVIGLYSMDFYFISKYL